MWLRLSQTKPTATRDPRCSRRVPRSAIPRGVRRWTPPSAIAAAPPGRRRGSPPPPPRGGAAVPPLWRAFAQYGFDDNPGISFADDGSPIHGEPDPHAVAMRVLGHDV